MIWRGRSRPSGVGRAGGGSFFVELPPTPPPAAAAANEPSVSPPPWVSPPLAEAAAAELKRSVRLDAFVQPVVPPGGGLGSLSLPPPPTPLWFPKWRRLSDGGNRSELLVAGCRPAAPRARWNCQTQERHGQQWTWCGERISALCSRVVVGVFMPQTALRDGQNLLSFRL